MEGLAFVAEKGAEYEAEKKIDYKSDAERREVEAAVEALVNVAASYFQYAEPATVKTLKRILTEEELKRHRRRQPHPDPLLVRRGRKTKQTKKEEG